MNVKPAAGKADSIRVLLVDDEESQLELAKLNIEAADPSLLITTASAPADVLNLLAAKQFDCVVSDYQMPGINGVQLCAEIRKNKNTPFILYTGKGSEEVCSIAFSVGVDDYIKKERELSHYQVIAKRIRHAVEKRRAEERLAQQALMLSEANDAIIGYDNEYRVTFWNREAERLYGYSEDEAMGKLSYDLLKPTYIGVTREDLIKRAKDTGRSESESIRVAKDGRRVNVESHVILLRSGDGDPIGYASIDRDITERREAEEQLRESEERLKASNEGLAALNEELQATEGELRASNEALAGYTSNLEEAVEESTREIKETTERLETFMAGATDGFSIYDSNLKLLDVNDAWLRRLPEGMGKEDVIGKNMTEIYPGIEETPRYREYLKVIDTGVPYSYEGYLSGSLVKRRYYEASVFKVGAGLGIVSRDVTERRHTQEALREAKERLEAFVESVSDPFVIWSHDLNLIEANSAFLSWFPSGTRKTDLIGKNIKKLAPSAENRERYPLFLRVLETGEPAFLHNVPSLTGYGDRRFDVKAFKLREGIGVLNYDVTGQIKADEKLREASLYARSLIEASLDPLVTINQEGKIMDVNNATELATGVPRDQLIGSEFSTYFTDPEKARQGYQRAFKEGHVINYPLVIRHRSGKTTDVLYNAIVYRDENGNVKGVFAAARDVTERRRLEAELVRAERMEAVGRLMAMLAHDLRNPLNFISQASEIARRQPEKADRMLQLIGENAGRSLRMIEELRTGTREISLQLVDTDLASLIGKVAEETRVPEKIKLEVVIGEGLGKVSLDAGLMRRVLDNLVSNAVEAMPDGGKLTLRASSEDGTVRVDVEDTGVGIPDEAIPHVFESFYTTKVKGFGLGLPFSRRAVEAHGGTLSFTTRRGVGTTFTVTLPPEAI